MIGVFVYMENEKNTIIYRLINNSLSFWCLLL